MQNMSSQSALDSASEPNRRQNSSCDPCRRSKRRCFFSSHAFDDSSTSCTHCTRLGHACTFKFAASRLNSRPRKRQRQTRSDVRSEQSPTHHGQIQSGSPLGTNRDSESCSSVSASTGTLDDFASCLNFDIDDYLANDLHSTIAIEPAALDSNISPPLVHRMSNGFRLYRRARRPCSTHSHSREGLCQEAHPAVPFIS